MKNSESNKNQCTLFNRHSATYLVVELGSIEHLEAFKKGYEYRGPSYAATITEINKMAEDNRLFIENLTENNNKVEYLKSLGFKVEGQYQDIISFSGDYDYNISTEDFEIGDAANQIVENSDIISCCGDMVDKDYMMCPSCREHI